jgi:hypothetical protein
MMSVRIRLFAVIVALLATSAATTAAAIAATPSCGPTCIDLASRAYGPATKPVFVLAARIQSPALSTPLTLARASNANAAEDFSASYEGVVSDFIAAGLMEPGMSIYDSNPAYQLNYAPFGVNTGLCAGVPTTPTNGTSVGLQPCGVSAKTVWVPSTPASLTGTVTLISGATDNNFSDPYVLTALLPGLPLLTWTLHTSTKGTPLALQQWAADYGVLPAAGSL